MKSKFRNIFLISAMTMSMLGSVALMGSSTAFASEKNTNSPKTIEVWGQDVELNEDGTFIPPSKIDFEEENGKTSSNVIVGYSSYAPDEDGNFKSVDIFEDEKENLLVGLANDTPVEVILEDEKTANLIMDWECDDDFLNTEKRQYTFTAKLPDGYSYDPNFESFIKNGTIEELKIKVNVIGENSKTGELYEKANNHGISTFASDGSYNQSGNSLVPRYRISWSKTYLEVLAYSTTYTSQGVYAPTWRDNTSATSGEWFKLSSGSWTRDGITYNYGIGINQSQWGSYVGRMQTHIYFKASNGALTNAGDTPLHGFGEWTDTYNTNGGTGWKQEVFVYGWKGTLPATSRTGYSFKNWTSSTGGSYGAQAQVVHDIVGSKTYTANWNVNQYYLDVNGRVDGVDAGNTNGGGTFDVYINGSLVANDVTDYYQALNYGTTYQIKDQKGYTGKSYVGVVSGSTSGTITGNTSVRLSYTTNSYSVQANPNGGYYTSNGSTSTTTQTAKYGSKVTVETPKRAGYDFVGWNQNVFSTNPTGNLLGNGYTNNASITNGNTSIYRTEAYTTYTFSNITNSGDAWGHITFGPYSIPANTQVNITGEIYVESNPVGLNFYHGGISNDYANNKYHLSGTTNGWVPFSITRTFTSATSTGYFEIYTNSLKGLNNATIKFSLRNVRIETGQGAKLMNDWFYMPANNVILTAKWNAQSHDIQYKATTGGSVSPTSETVKSGETPKGSTATANSGYLFDGWYNGNTKLGTNVLLTPYAPTNITKSDYFGIYGANSFYNPSTDTYQVIASKANANTSWGSGIRPTVSVGIPYGKWYTTSFEVYSPKDVTMKIDFNNTTGYGSGSNSDWNNNDNDVNRWNSSLNVKANTWTTISFGYQNAHSGNTSQKAIRDYSYINVDMANQTSDVSIQIRNIRSTVSSQKLEIANTYTAKFQISSRTATFDANGGTTPSPSTIIKNYGQALGTLPTTTRTGYIFAGWYTAANGGTKISSTTTMPANNVTYYAHWTPISYRIAYNGNDATSGSTVASTHTYDVAKALTTNGFVRTGYTFAGWNTKKDGTGTAYANGASVKNLASTQDATITLYAQWIANDYNIAFNGNGATSGTMANMSMTYDVAKNLTANAFKKTGYLFKNWNTKADGSGTSYADKTAVKNLTATHNGSVTLYAQWTPITYTVQFHGHGGTQSDGNDLATQTMTYDKAINLIDPEFKMARYLFKHWTTNQDGSGTVYTLKQSVKNLASTQGAIVHLYAQWELKQFTAFFHEEGGTTPVPYYINGQYEQKLGTLPTTTRRGYTFEGWYEAPGGVGSKVSEDTMLYLDTIDFYANWTINTYNISYDTTGGELPSSQKNPETYTVETDSFTLKNPTKTGYIFAGWTGSNGSTPQTTVTIPKGTIGDLSYTANWTPISYTIAYNANGGTSGTTANSTHTYNVAKNLTANGFSRPGYVFREWNTKADGSGAKYANNASVINLSTTQGATVTLYAQWDRKAVTITFNGNGGTSPGAMTYLAGDQFGALPDSTRNGYTFEGWYTAASGGTQILSTSAVPNDNATYYAHWRELSYSITYTLGSNVSDPGNPKTYKITTPTFTLKNPTKTGYTFLGWTGSNGSTPQTTVTINQGSFGNREYKANWRANTYTIVFDGNGATSGTMTNQNMTYDVEKNLNQNKYVRTGYTFAGWNTKVDGSGTSYIDSEIVKNLSSAANGTVTLYAQWNINSYNLNLHANTGGSKDTVILEAGKASSTNNDGKTIENTGGTDTRYRIEFLTADVEHGLLSVRVTGIYGALNGEAKTFESQKTSLINVINDDQLKTIFFKPNGGVTTVDKKYFVINTAMGDMPTPKRIGYTFVGWFTDPIDGTEVTESTILGEEDVTVWAHWSDDADPYTYTINYNGNGATSGSTASSHHVFGISSRLTVNGFTRTGHRFVGWNTKADGTGTSYTNNENVKNLVKVDGGSLTLYAQWQAMPYTATFDPRGGSAANPTTITREYGDTLGDLPTTSRTGYTFQGWFTAASGGTKISSATTMPANNVTYYAQWTPNTYTVTFNGNGATSGTMANQAMTYGTSKALTTNSFSRTGYTFAGWNTKADGSGTSYANGTPVLNLTATQNGTVTLYAQWTVKSYVASFNSNGGTVANPSALTVKYDHALGTLPITTRNGYTFEGWYTAASGGTKISSATTMPANNVTYYAHWQANTYTIAFNGNGSTSGSMSNLSMSYDTAKTLTNNGFVRTGYTFKSWNTQPDGSGTSYGNGASVKNLTATQGSTVTLYAQWTINNYTVIFDGNGGTTSGTGSITKQYNTALGTLPTATRTGYTFVGWYTLPTGGTEVTELTRMPLNGATYYAHWTTKSYVATFNANGGGTVTPSTITKDYGSELGTLPTVSKTGYTFNGWYTAVSGGAKISSTTKMPSNNVTYYAQWTPNTYIIKFDGNGATSGTMSTQAMTYDVSKSLVANTFKKDKYIFTGWNTKADGSGTDYVDQDDIKNLTATQGSTVTLYAQWQAAEVTLLSGSSFNSVDGVKTAKKIVFTTSSVPEEYKDLAKIVSATDSVGKAYLYTIGDTTYVSPEYEDMTMYANADSASMFKECQELTSIQFDNFDTSKVTDMSSMFFNAGYNATTWNIGDLSKWETGNVTNMSSMFYYAGYNATTWNIGNLADWDVTNITNMSRMFGSAGYKATTWNIGDLSDWDVSNVTNMSYMFSSAGNNATTWSVGDLSDWNVSNVKYMSDMFFYAGESAKTWSIGDLSNWKTENVVNMSSMFQYAGYKATTFDLGNLSSWNVANVTNMSDMFQYAGRYATTWNIGDLSDWDVSNVTNMRNMFSYTDCWNIGDLSDWNTSKVTDMRGMFFGIYRLTGSITIKNANTVVQNGTSIVDKMFGSSASASDAEFVVYYGEGCRDKAKEAVATRTSENVHLCDTLLTLDVNGGNAMDTTSVLVPYNTAIGEVLPTPTKDGMEFAGWNTKADGSGTEVTELSKFKEDVTLYAQWQAADITLASGSTFNNKLKAADSAMTSLTFTTTSVPANKLATAIDISDGNGGKAYLYQSDVEHEWVISPENDGGVMYANANSSSMFKNLKNVTSIQFDNFDTSRVTNMSWMFSNVGQNATTFKLNLSQWDTSNVTDMSYMFYYAGYSATTWSIGDLSNWKTENVTNMSGMFASAGTSAMTWSIGDLSDWDVSKVTNMSSMFSYSFTTPKTTVFDIGDLSNWNVSNVTDMSSMFMGAGKSAKTFNLGNVGKWNVSKVINMSNMFTFTGQNATTWNIGDLSGWDTSNVTTMASLFYSAGENATTWSVGDLSNWETGNVTNMSGMFVSAGETATMFNLGNIGKWNTSNVTDMRSMFYFAGQNATTWNIGDLSGWNTSNVMDMYSMFMNAGYKSTKFSLGDLSGWDTSKVTNMYYMFHQAGYDSKTWDIGDLSGWDTSKVTTMQSMFEYAGYNATTFNIGDLSQWDTSNVTNMSAMFARAGYSSTIFNLGDLSSWNTSKVTTMSWMFGNAGHSATIWSIGQLKDWDTSKVTDMQAMFANIPALNSSITIMNPDVIVYSSKTSTMYYNPMFGASATADGAEFIVYYNDDCYNIAVEAVATKGIENGNVHLFETRTIEYDLGNGVVDNTDNPERVDIDDTVSLEDPSRVGYTFTGWTGSNGDTPEMDVVIDDSYFETNEPIHFEAHWSPNVSTLSFDANGASGSMANQKLVYDSELKLPNLTFTKQGAQFKGWVATHTYSTGPLKGQKETFCIDPNGQTSWVLDSERPAMIQPKVFSNQEVIKNLRTDSKQIIVLQAQWSNQTYSFDYDNNVLSSRHGSVITETSDSLGFGDAFTFQIQSAKPSSSGLFNYTEWHFNQLAINHSFVSVPGSYEVGASVSSILPTGEKVQVTLSKRDSESHWGKTYYRYTYDVVVTGVQSNLEVTEVNFKDASRQEIIVKQADGIKNLIGWEGNNDDWMDCSLNSVLLQTSDSGNEFYFNTENDITPVIKVLANGQVQSIQAEKNSEGHSLSASDYEWRFNIPSGLGDNVEVFIGPEVEYTVSYADELSGQILKTEIIKGLYRDTMKYSLIVPEGYVTNETEKEIVFYSLDAMNIVVPVAKN